MKGSPAASGKGKYCRKILQCSCHAQADVYTDSWRRKRIVRAPRKGTVMQCALRGEMKKKKGQRENRK